MEKVKKLVKEMKGYNTTTPTTYDETHPHPERGYATTGDDRHPSIHEATRHGTTGPAGTEQPSSGRRRSVIDRLINGPDDNPPRSQKENNDGMSRPMGTVEPSGQRRSSGGASGRRRSSIVARLIHGSTEHATPNPTPHDDAHAHGTRDHPTTGAIHPSIHESTHGGTAGPLMDTTSKSQGPDDVPAFKQDYSVKKATRYDGAPPAGYP